MVIAHTSGRFLIVSLSYPDRFYFVNVDDSQQFSIILKDLTIFFWCTDFSRNKNSIACTTKRRRLNANWLHLKQNRVPKNAYMYCTWGPAAMWRHSTRSNAISRECWATRAPTARTRSHIAVHNELTLTLNRRAWRREPDPLPVLALAIVVF